MSCTKNQVIAYYLETHKFMRTAMHKFCEIRSHEINLFAQTTSIWDLNYPMCREIYKF